MARFLKHEITVLSIFIVTFAAIEIARVTSVGSSITMNWLGALVCTLVLIRRPMFGLIISHRSSWVTAIELCIVSFFTTLSWSVLRDGPVISSLTSSVVYAVATLISTPVLCFIFGKSFSRSIYNKINKDS